MCQFKQFFVAGWPQIFYKRTTKGKKTPEYILANLMKMIEPITVINFPQRGNISSNIQREIKGDASIRLFGHLIPLSLCIWITTTSIRVGITKSVNQSNRQNLLNAKSTQFTVRFFNKLKQYERMSFSKLTNSQENEAKSVQKLQMKEKMEYESDILVWFVVFS